MADKARLPSRTSHPADGIHLFGVLEAKSAHQIRPGAFVLKASQERLADEKKWIVFGARQIRQIIQISQKYR